MLCKFESICTGGMMVGVGEVFDQLVSVQLLQHIEKQFSVI